MVRKLKTIYCPMCFALGKLKEKYFQYSCDCCGDTWVLDGKKKIIQEDKAK